MRRATMATLAPREARSRAVARPIPLEPPVMIAVMPFSVRLRAISSSRRLPLKCCTSGYGFEALFAGRRWTAFARDGDRGESLLPTQQLSDDLPGCGQVFE